MCYLWHIDAVNLYGKSMLFSLPSYGFKFSNQQELSAIFTHSLIEGSWKLWTDDFAHQEYEINQKTSEQCNVDIGYFIECIDDVSTIACVAPGHPSKTI